MEYFYANDLFCLDAKAAAEVMITAKKIIIKIRQPANSKNCNNILFLLPCA
jgi:hypothetical protein